MDCYSGEVMNAHRDAMSAHDFEVREYREAQIAAGAQWFHVKCKGTQGDTFVIETLAFTHEEARKDTLENKFVVEIVDIVTEAEAEAL